MKTIHKNILHQSQAPSYGGLIYPSDFDTIHGKSRNMASRIAADWQFQRHCRKNEELRDLRAKDEEVNRYGKREILS